MRTLTRALQQSLTPAEALALLKEGNIRFVNNLKANRDLLQQVNETRDGQFPFAIVLSCIDSRTSVELIFDQGLGDVFSARIAGNIVNDDILGSMEFACKLAGSKLIVVLGHTHCGAIQGACDGIHLEHLTGLLAKIQPAIASAQKEATAEIERDRLIERVAKYNVRLTVDQILEKSHVLKGMAASGEIGIAGGMYDIETGQVDFFSDSDNDAAGFE